MKFRIFTRKDDLETEVVEFDYEPPLIDGHKMPMAHCDSLILHAPGACQYCDHYPEAQALRAWWQMNYTNEHDPAKLPCPSTLRRNDKTRDLWGGNRAVTR